MKNRILLYDADCPLCNAYSSAFVKTGLLEEGGRQAYQQIGPYTKQIIDMDRARNEIALLNKQTGQVTYGYKSLVEILGSRWTWIKTVFKIQFLGFLLKHLYGFISYNRKIIVPGGEKQGYLSCIPDEHIGYRSAFLLVCMFVVNAIVGSYFTNWLGSFGHHIFQGREAVFFIGQQLFQFVAMKVIGEKQVYDYLGHVSFISCMGAVILSGLAMVCYVLHAMNLHTTLIAPFGFGAVFCWMFMEHRRRINLAGMDKRLTWTWLLYRICIYPIAFII